ncbi:MAG: hypothetical protein M3P01_07490 [Actinomycetota bacterium]|nr:hypothetical protein [Actinomycetota bacterium]
MDDDRLRDSLRQLADQVGEPVPSRTPMKQARLRLTRNISLAVLGVAAISVLGFAAFGQLNRPGPAPADIPPSPTSSARPSPGQSRLVFVYSSHGNLYGEYADGAHRLLVHGTTAQPALHPTLSPDMKAVVFQQGHSRRASLADLDVKSDNQCCFREGAFPSYGPHDLVARVAHLPGQPLSIAIGVPTSEAEQVYPVLPEVGEVRDLSWDRTGKYLFYRGIYKPGHRPVVNGEVLAESVFKAAVAYGPHHAVYNLVSTPLTPRNRQPGEYHWGPSAGVDLNVLKVCCQLNGHGAFSHIELGKIDVTVPGTPYSKITDLTSLGINLQTCSCVTAFGGDLAAQQSGGAVHWSTRSGESWFVGDGSHMWWVDDAGDIVKMPFEVTGGIGLPDHRFNR